MINKLFRVKMLLDRAQLHVEHAFDGHEHMTEGEIPEDSVLELLRLARANSDAATLLLNEILKYPPSSQNKGDNHDQQSS